MRTSRYQRYAYLHFKWYKNGTLFNGPKSLRFVASELNISCPTTVTSIEAVTKIETFTGMAASMAASIAAVLQLLFKQVQMLLSV